MQYFVLRVERVCCLFRARLEYLSIHTEESSLAVGPLAGAWYTRGRGKVLEQTGGQISVRGTKQRTVIFLLRYLGI